MPSTSDSECPHGSEVADQYLDGGAHGKVKRHARTCSQCGETAEMAGRVHKGFLAAFPGPALGDFLFVRQQADRLRRWRWARKFVFIAALLTLVWILAWILS